MGAGEWKSAQITTLAPSDRASGSAHWLCRFDAKELLDPHARPTRQHREGSFQTGLKMTQKRARGRAQASPKQGRSSRICRSELHLTDSQHGCKRLRRSSHTQTVLKKKKRLKNDLNAEV